MPGEHDLAVSFSVPFRYSVHFTERFLDPENRTLLEVLQRLEPTRRQRVLAVVDDGVERPPPALAVALRRYAAAHATGLQLLGEPLVVPGGERAKNDPGL